MVITLTCCERVHACACADFLRHIFPRIVWPAFLQGAESVSCALHPYT